ncbi:hypothetical protein Tco_0688212 [Tanacetum coccineum]
MCYQIGSSYHLSIRCAPFEGLYGRKCRSPVLWAEIGESSLIGPELVQETTDKVVLIKEKLRAADSGPSSAYAYNRSKQLGKLALSLHVPLDEIKVDKTLCFVKELVENSDREIKRLKCSRMVVVKGSLGVLAKVGCLYAFMWIMWEIGSQSIECDHLNEIEIVIALELELDLGQDLGQCCSDCYLDDVNAFVKFTVVFDVAQRICASVYGSCKASDRGTCSVPLFVVLERDRLRALMDNTSSTNEVVNTVLEVSTASSQRQASSSTYVDDVMFSFFVNQSNSPQLDNEDVEQIDTDDLEEIDLKWLVAMLTMRVKRFLKKTRRNLNFNIKEIVSFDKTNVECYNCHRRVETPANALVVQDGIGGYDWSFQAEEDLQNQFEKLLKEKDDLKLKLEKFEESSKNLTKLINSQISAKDKAGLGYDSQMNESEVVHSVFNSRESDVDDSSVNDRFKIDDSVYKTKVSETETSISKTSKDIVEKPKTVRPSSPIIEDWDTDSDNDSVFRPKSDQTKPKFTKINFVKSDENVKTVNKENTNRQVEYPKKSQSPRDNRRN